MLPLDYKGSRSSSGECNSKGIWSVDRAMVEPDRPLLILPNSTASSDATETDRTSVNNRHINLKLCDIQSFITFV
jgi:hypothetical protein